MLLLSLHIVAIAALIGISGNIGYQMGFKKGLLISTKESDEQTGSSQSKNI